MVSNEKSQSAVDLLRQDHDNVLELFKRCDQTQNREEKDGIVKTICTELSLHMELEEQFVYPAAAKGLNDERFIEESVQEHDEVKVLIAQLQRLLIDLDYDEWEENVNRLHSSVESHVQEEEELLFPRLEASEMDLMALGEDILKVKADRKKPPEWIKKRDAA